jgi:hypothetical protein
MKNPAWIAGLVAMLSTSTAFASEDLCYDLVEGLWHQPRTEDVVKCVNRKWWQHALSPHCSTPACKIMPDCHIIEHVTTPGYLQTTQCNVEPKQALDLWFRGILKAPPDIVNLWTGQLKTRGSHLPTGLLNLLISMKKSKLMAGLEWLDEHQLRDVYWIKESSARKFPGIGVPDGNHGLTLSNLIILTDARFNILVNNPAPSLDTILCNYESLANIDDDTVPSGYQEAFTTLLHELTHVWQYAEMGENLFYTSWALSRDKVEREVNTFVNEVEERATEHYLCNRTPGDEIELRADGDGLAIYGGGSVKLNDRAKILSVNQDSCLSDSCYSDVASFSSVRVGNDAVVGNVRAQKDVFLSDRAQVKGEVKALGGLSWGNGVGMRYGYFAAEPFASGGISLLFKVTLAGPIAFPTSTQSPSVDRNIVLHLQPGAYQNVTVQSGGGIRIGSGTYYIQNLTLEPGATVYQSGVSRVFINRNWIHRGTIVGKPEDLLFGYMGTSPVHLESKLVGTLLAPRADVILQGGNYNLPVYESHRGAVYSGGSVEVHQDTRFVFAPFLHPWSP